MALTLKKEKRSFFFFMLSLFDHFLKRFLIVFLLGLFFFPFQKTLFVNPMGLSSPSLFLSRLSLSLHLLFFPLQPLLSKAMLLYIFFLLSFFFFLLCCSCCCSCVFG